jgi:hypothetical protein
MTSWGVEYILVKYCEKNICCPGHLEEGTIFWWNMERKTYALHDTLSSRLYFNRILRERPTLCGRTISLGKTGLDWSFRATKPIGTGPNWFSCGPSTLSNSLDQLWFTVGPKTEPDWTFKHYLGRVNSGKKFHQVLGGILGGRIIIGIQQPSTYDRVNLAHPPLP